MRIKVLHLIWTILFCVAISGCSNRKSDSEGISECGVEYGEISVDLSPAFYDSIFSTLSKPELIVLKESENVMFSEINKIVATGGRYYIMDAYGARTVVSFDESGNAYATYGKVGQGPGEYVRPRDIDVDSDFIYVLDANSKKIIRYDLEGDFICENEIPFLAEGFKRLKDGKFIFNLSPDGGKASPRLCIADSTLSDFKYSLFAPDGYFGGVVTDDNFRSTTKGLSFYQAPSDTIYFLNDFGKITGGLILDFGNVEVPDEAKLDFVSAREKGLLDNSYLLYNSPIQLSNGLMVASIVNGYAQYALLFDPVTGLCGAHRCEPESSIYDIFEICTTDDKGRLVCYTDVEYAKEAEGYNSLPDSIKAALDNDDNYYMITLYSFDQ